MNLTDAQKKFLRTLAHPKKPVVIIGNAGLTDAVVKEIDQALDAHELIKVRARVERDERDELIAEILDRTRASQIQRIGHVLTLFRRNHAKPKIDFPR
ncbi:MAG: ribosome assembly RNA-binding protein YhbY [Gammaproteobacteria bacterium]